MAKRMTSQIEQMMIMKMLDENLEKKPTGWVYKEGWSDERVAAAASQSTPPLPAGAVKYRRESVFPPVPVTNIDKFSEQVVAELVHRLAEAEQMIDDMESRLKGVEIYQQASMTWMVEANRLLKLVVGSTKHAGMRKCLAHMDEHFVTVNIGNGATATSMKVPEGVKIVVGRGTPKMG